MDIWLQRQDLMIGMDNTQKIAGSVVMIIGLGGVGGAAVEALCRSGVENFILVDADVFDVTNLNRQILATTSSLGKSKAKIAKERINSINENANCIIKEMFYLPEKKDVLFDCKIDYIVDAIDTITAKIDIIKIAKEKNIKIISSMGMGNRLNPLDIRVSDIEDTKGNNCGLSRVLRRELRKLGISNVRVVHSTEIPEKTVIESSGRHAPGSVSFVPPVAGYVLASEVIKDIINK